MMISMIILHIANLRNMLVEKRQKKIDFTFRIKILFMFVIKILIFYINIFKKYKIKL